jgi:hypothetical protein
LYGFLVTSSNFVDLFLFKGYTHAPNPDLACDFTKMELRPLFTPGSGSLFRF